MPQLKYGSYDGAAPRIALVLTPLNEDNLLLAAQVGATDIVYYNMDSSEWSHSSGVVQSCHKRPSPTATSEAWACS
jgi:hypothetical protein